MTLANSMLSILHGNKKWTYAHQKILCSSVYTYLRLIEDQSTLLNKNSAIVSLRQWGIQFCTEAIRERFFDIITVGRDLVRVVFQLAFKHKIPEMESVWKELFIKPQQAPADLSPAVPEEQKVQAYTGLHQVLSVPTRARCLSSRVSTEMERELSFIMTNVKMGNQRRYQLWFQQRFLNTPESDMLIVDLIRYICCVFHPPNHILAGNFTTRWAMVGWLLKSLKSQQIDENAKFALIFDWLFCNKKENVMNLEPALLLMVHSIPKYMDITSTILETIMHFDTTSIMGVPKENIAQNVHRAVEILVTSGVVPSLAMLSDCTKLDQSLRDKLKKHFPRFTQPPASHPQPQQGAHPVHSPVQQPPSPVKGPQVRRLSDPHPVKPTAPSGSVIQPPTQPQIMHRQPPINPVVHHIKSSTSEESPPYAKPAFEAPTSPVVKAPQPEESAPKTEEIPKPEIRTESEQKSTAGEGGSITSDMIDDSENYDVSDDESDNSVRNLLDALIQSSTASKGKFTELFEQPLKKLASQLLGNVGKRFVGDEPSVQTLTTIMETLEKNSSVNEQIIQQLATVLMKLFSIELAASMLSADVTPISIHNNIHDQQFAHMQRVLLFADQSLFYVLFDHIFKVVMSVLSNKEEKPAAADSKQPPTPKKRISKESKQAKDVLTSFVKHACIADPSCGYRALCYCIRKLYSKTLDDESLRECTPVTSFYVSTLLNSSVTQLKGSILTFYEWLLHVRRPDATQNSEPVFITDIKACIIENPLLLVNILPILSREMSQHIRRSRLQLYRLLVKNMYPSYMQNMLSHFRNGRIRILFSKQKPKKQTGTTPANSTNSTASPTSNKLPSVADAVALMEKSLQWEDHYEQDIFWDILHTEIFYQQKQQMQFAFTGELDVENKNTDNKNEKQNEGKVPFQIFSMSDYIVGLFSIPGFDVGGRNALDKVQRLVVGVASLFDYLQTVQDDDPVQSFEILNYDAIKTILSLSPAQYSQFPSNLLFEYVQAVGTSVSSMLIHILKLMEDDQQTQVKNRDDILVHLLNVKYLEMSSEGILVLRLFQTEDFMRQLHHLTEKWKNKKQQFFILSQLIEGHTLKEKQEKTAKTTRSRVVKSTNAGTRKSTRKRRPASRKLPWDDDESSGEEDFIVKDEEVDEPAQESNDDENQEEENEGENDEEDNKTTKRGATTSVRRRRIRRNIEDDEDEEENEESDDDEKESNDKERNNGSDSETEKDNKKKAPKRRRTRDEEEENEDEEDENGEGGDEEEEEESEEDLESKYLKNQSRKRRRITKK